MTFEVLLAVGGVIVATTLVAATVVRSAALRAGALMSGAFGLFSVEAFGYFRFRIDDAYITYRYARNLAAGVGPVWNPGERVEGYTSFLWMVLLAALHRVGIDIGVAATILSSASVLALVVLTWRVWRRLAPDADGDGMYDVALGGVALLVAANSSTAQWGMSGLETPLAAALIMALVLTYQRESRVPGVPLSALVLTAAVMTRPEMIFMAAVAGAFFFDQAITDSRAARWRHFAAFCAVFLALTGTWFLWRWSYYGYVFPNTYYVKVGPADLMIERGWWYVNDYWWSYLVAPGLVASVTLPFVLQGARRRDAAFICAVCVVWLTAVVTEGGDAFDRARFIEPVLAPMYVALGLALSLAVRRVAVRPAYRMAALSAALVGAMLFVGWAPGAKREMERNRHTLAQWETAGSWVRDNVPPDYVTAVFAAGVVPYYSERPSLDMLGLTDTTIAHTDISYREGLTGHEKYNIDYALDVRRPQLIFLGIPSPRPTTAADMKRAISSDFGLVQGVNALIHDERTWQQYEMAAFWHDGLWYPFLVRKDVEDNVRAGWIESKGMIASATANR